MAETLPGLDLDALTGYLARVRPGLVGGPLHAELITGGRSNLTFGVTDGTSEWVLRRPPLGHVLSTAHDMTREFRVIGALRPTTVPVPDAVLLCRETDVIGAPFYLMRRAPGRALRHRADAAGLSSKQAGELSGLLIDTLADLHAVDPDRVGLGDFGRPHGYLRRQVDRWGTQLAASRSRDLPGIDTLHARLADTVPDSGRAAILHGDYRVDNVLVITDPPRITAVLDWEMATLGDPLADLGLFVLYWRGLGRAADPITGGVVSAPGFPPIGELLDRYAARTGSDLSTLDWYVALASFKLAVILEGIHFRFGQGKTVGGGFAGIGDLVPSLVEGGLHTLDGGGLDGQ